MEELSEDQFFFRMSDFTFDNFIYMLIVLRVYICCKKLCILAVLTFI